MDCFFWSYTKGTKCGRTFTQLKNVGLICYQTEQPTPNDVGQLFPLMTYAKKGEPKGRTIEGVLYFLNEREREIMTKVPMTFFHEQFINSVIAVVQIAVDHLDERHRKHLRNSLKSMIEIYQSGVNPSLIKNIHIVPNQAFWIQYFTSM